jgi:pimeloyl-ACP methyl ester carboxylesterase
MRRLVVVVAVALTAAGCGSVEVATRLDGTRPFAASASAAPATGVTLPLSIPSTSAPSNGTTSSTVTPAGMPATTPATTAVTPPAPAPAPLAWSSCGTRLQCATLAVPKDYTDLTKGTLNLFLKRRSADQKSKRVGSLLVNPGGPGVPATIMADQAIGYFGKPLLDRFDIVAWDPRGTGKSGQIVCVDSLDPYFSIDLSPDDDAERRATVDAATAFARECGRRNADLLPYVTTEATARDMEQIRRALGEPKISYFGFSYGSELGAVWATLFPATVRAMVIDGALDPTVDPETLALQDAVGVERALTNLLTACARDATCPINNGGDPGATFDRVMASLDRTPLSVPDDPGRPLVNQGVAWWAVLSVLYESELWPALTSAFAEALRGNGRPLLDLYDSYLTTAGQFPHVFDALIAIRCADTVDVGTAEEDARVGAELLKVAPRMGPYQSSQPFCRVWPVKGHTPVHVTGVGAGPVVVVGTTGDPVTPFESSRGMAAALEGGVFITADADKHTGYQSSSCIDDAIESYLIQLRVPKDGLVCGRG